MDTNPQESEHFLPHSDLLCSDSDKTDIADITNFEDKYPSPRRRHENIMDTTVFRTLYSRQGYHLHSWLSEEGTRYFFRSPAI
jgi:hypothetical protein